jgi:hypothetical protein
MFNKIKESLPNLPDDVISSWLVPIAEGGYGWPPTAVGLGNWRYVLCRKSLDYWRKTIWKNEKVTLEEKELCPSSIVSVRGLIGTYVFNQINEYSNLENGPLRFQRLLEFIHENGTLPVPPVMKRQQNGLETLDGNHRVAALVYIRALWRHEQHKPSLLKEGYTIPTDTHTTWTFIPPQEGQYIPDPLTAEQDRVARQILGS